MAAAAESGSRWRAGGYWVVTVLVAYELVASSIWAVVGTEYAATNLTRLGYPLYFWGANHINLQTGYAGVAILSLDEFLSQYALPNDFNNAFSSFAL